MIFELLLLVAIIVLPIVTARIWFSAKQAVEKEEAEERKGGLKKGLFRLSIIESVLLLIFVTSSSELFGSEVISTIMLVVLILIWTTWFGYWVLGWITRYIKRGFIKEEPDDGKDKWWPPRD